MQAPHDMLGIDAHFHEHHHVHVYSFIALAVSFAFQAVGCAYASARGSPAAMEAFSGLTIALACTSTLVVRGTYLPRQVFCTLVMSAWGVRLSHYLGTRRLPAGTPPPAQLMVPRTVWAFMASLPTVYVNTVRYDPLAFTANEWVGCALAVGGVAGEALADWQKARWHRAHEADPKPDAQKIPFCTDGLWALSKHPNHFFNITVQLGVFLVVMDVARPVLVAALGPLVNVAALLFMPGGTYAMEYERRIMYISNPAFRKYDSATPLLVPIPRCRNA